MSAGVLFDTAGPATRARHRIYSIVAGVALLGLIAFLVYRMQATGQFEYDKWEPFITPKYIEAILVDGLLITLQLAFIAIIGAVVFGLLFGVGKLSEHSFVRWPCWLVVEFFRAVPVILLIVFCFYAVFGGMDPLSRRTYWAVVMALTLYNGAVLAEVFRAGINAVPKGQAEAAYAIGMRKTQVMSVVLLPQAVKIMIPAIISQMVVALKDTSLILIVFGVGLTKILKQLPLSFNNIVPTTLVIAGLYVLTNLVLTAIANYAQKKFVGEKEMLQVSVIGDPGAAGGV